MSFSNIDSSGSLDIQVVAGNDIVPHLQAIARLRISVFRSYPYLYDGDMAYEEKYLATYANKPGAMTVLALDENRIAVGASTALPLEDETAEVRAPFLKSGIASEDVFYFGESVLESSYRGRGIGVRFFEEREKYARDLSSRRNSPFRYLAFCAVERPPDHPLKPAGYMPLDLFWKKRGFKKHPDMQTTFSWKDIGEPNETKKTMTFWLKEL